MIQISQKFGVNLMFIIKYISRTSIGSSGGEPHRKCNNGWCSGSGSVKATGDGCGLCSNEGGVGNILLNSSGRTAPVRLFVRGILPILLNIVVSPLSSPPQPGILLLESGGV